MNWDETAPPTPTTTTGAAAAERLVGAAADGEDQAVEAALRPKDLDEFVGQERVREQLDLVLRGRPRARRHRRPRAALRRARASARPPSR